MLGPVRKPPPLGAPQPQRPLPVRRPVRRPVTLPPQPLAIEEVGQPPQSSLWETLPFTSLEISCTRFERQGTQTHVSERSVHMENGVLETQRVDAVVDADVCDAAQRQMAYDALATFFSMLSTADPPKPK